ncbi:hypothetical protein BPAE_0387g00020 [Botrytis paeoniae]|uniref:Uncharacterized protein n=1 Tax=Botrytis paeoniae TaxID=278948 RepID=A0A4Z1F689_9HELO|nr:hypothetical protein BPAE_0387g00020 [Botrytis paeoniae]
MSRTSSLNVVIIGGSLSGLMHGIVLHRLGHRVHILERSMTLPEGQGAGISCRAYTQKLLDKFDLTKVPYYILSDKVHLLDHEGRTTRMLKISTKTTSWLSLYYKLRINFDCFQSEFYPERIPLSRIDEAKYELGQTVVDVKCEDDHRMVVDYESTADPNGKKKSLQADLVIVADGARSRIRRVLQPKLPPPKYTGYIAWRGMVPENEISVKFRGVLTGHTSLFHGKQGHIIIYLIPGENGSLKPGERVFNWVWYCNYAENSEELKEIMTDSDGHFYPGRYSMPIGKIRISIWNRQKDIAAEVLPPLLADTVQKTTRPFIQSINELRSPRASFFDGKLLMVGDALACCRPHAPSSIEQAALNALLFHDLLQGKITAAEWENRALQYSHAAFLRSKSYGLYWQYGLTWELFFALVYFGWSKVYEWVTVMMGHRSVGW